MIVNDGASVRPPAYIGRMERQEKTRRLLAGLTGVALVGLIILQSVLLVNAYELKQQAFRRNAEAALNAAARSLEVESTLSQVFDVHIAADAAPRRAGRQPRGEAYTYVTTNPQRVRLTLHSSSLRDSVLFDSVAGPGKVVVPMPDRTAGAGVVTYAFSTDSVLSMTRIDSGGEKSTVTVARTPESRNAVISRVIENIWRSPAALGQLPVKPAVLDSTLRTTIARSGLPDDLAYGVTTYRGDSLLFASRNEESAHLLASDLRVPLSLIDPLGPHLSLVAYFPGRERYLVQQLGVQIAASLLFVAMIAVSFVITLRTINRQRSLMGMLTDFVNTMTHEFKTPIATIALASEAIGRPDVVQRKAKIVQYNRIIAEEAARMKSQVSRILEMAHLESHESEINRRPVDLHALALRASTSFALQVESRGGALTTSLEAASHTVEGDDVHLEGVIHNLLDNAVKYSSGPPSVSLRTRNLPGRIEMSIADRGRGIPAASLAMVFEKYFRVPQGNRHDVKGFGLGLSYVRLVVRAHGGEVSIASTEGSGTTVVVLLPVIEHENTEEKGPAAGR
jgi:signal transduction histidine kinase